MAVCLYWWKALALCNTHVCFIRSLMFACTRNQWFKTLFFALQAAKYASRVHATPYTLRRHGSANGGASLKIACMGSSDVRIVLCWNHLNSTFSVCKRLNHSCMRRCGLVSDDFVIMIVVMITRMACCLLACFLVCIVLLCCLWMACRLSQWVKTLWRSCLAAECQWAPLLLLSQDIVSFISQFPSPFLCLRSRRWGVVKRDRLLERRHCACFVAWQVSLVLSFNCSHYNLVVLCNVCDEIFWCKLWKHLRF